MDLVAVSLTDQGQGAFFHNLPKTMSFNKNTIEEVFTYCKLNKIEKLGLTPWGKGEYGSFIQRMKEFHDEYPKQISLFHLSKKDFKELRDYNDIRPILNVAFSASEKLKEFELYYQPNIDNFVNMEITKFFTEEYLKQSFDDYCNYFDKHKINQIIRVNKKFYNYSKNKYETFPHYPEDIKMILVIENFNFWDFNSQLFMAHVLQKNHKKWRPETT